SGPPDPAETRAGAPTAESREAFAARLARERGLTLIPPFDHPDILAGQGTAACELIEEAGPLDALLVPVGGGGLISGSAIAARHGRGDGLPSARNQGRGGRQLFGPGPSASLRTRPRTGAAAIPARSPSSGVGLIASAQARAHGVDR